MVSRSEHRRATLLQISLATTETFEELGTGATFDDIAKQAGLSRRTLFRYVETKEDLAFIHPMMWLDIFDQAVTEMSDLPLRQRVLHAAHSISVHIDADPDPVRRAMMVAMSDPVLMRGNATVNRRWVARIAAEVRGESTDSEVIFRSGVLGAAVMGVIEAALAEWFMSDPQPPLADLVDRGLDYLAPLFPNE